MGGTCSTRAVEDERIPSAARRPRRIGRCLRVFRRRRTRTGESETITTDVVSSEPSAIEIVHDDEPSLPLPVVRESNPLIICKRAVAIINTDEHLPKVQVRPTLNALSLFSSAPRRQGTSRRRVQTGFRHLATAFLGSNKDHAKKRREVFISRPPPRFGGLKRPP